MAALVVQVLFLQSVEVLCILLVAVADQLGLVMAEPVELVAAVAAAHEVVGQAVQVVVQHLTLALPGQALQVEPLVQIPEVAVDLDALAGLLVMAVLDV